jgi:DNA invertase Pin-like site-specific DNA recombinase
MKTPETSLQLAAYTRVSTHGQATSGIGLAAQRQTITDAATTQGFTIGEWFEDAGKSGAKMAGRPGLQAALTAIRAGRYGGLVVAKIDRLGRSYETMTLVGDASREGWRLVAVDMGLDSATPEGELVAGALTMAARFEWRRISQRQREKFDELRRQGRKRGRPATPADVADRIVALREGGATYQAIADVLNGDKVPTVRGGGEWRPSSIRSALVSRLAELLAQTA